MKRVSYTSAEVEALITGALAGARPMIPEECESQRRSFVHGTVAMSNTEVTREMVDEVAEEMDEPAPVREPHWVSKWWGLPVAVLLWVGILAVVYTVAPNGAREHVEVAK